MLVNIYTYTVPQRMSEILVQTVFFEITARKRVALLACHAVGNVFFDEHMRL